MLIQFGDENDAVLLLQMKLGMKPVGWFGSITFHKVMEFQIKNNISPTGIVNDETWEKIMKEL